jgi:predicted Zn-ribbon and HTH transcriptional regulator
MMISLIARDPCGLCGYVREGFMVATVRINKRSMRTHGNNLSLFPGECRECRWVAPWPAKVKLCPTADDAAKINAYRLRKWPELARETSG